MLKFLYSFIFLVALSLTPAYGQKLTRDDNTGFYKLDTIVNSTQSKEVLFENAIDWINSRFQKGNGEILSSNKETGEIIFKGSGSNYLLELVQRSKKKVEKMYTPFYYYFNGKIIVKDNTYRLIFTDIESSHLNHRLPLLQQSLDNDNPLDVQIFDYIKMYQKSFIRVMDKKPDSDF